MRASHSGADRVARVTGLTGAALGIIAGIVQLSLGSEIPEWTGDKLHPVQLGIVTVGLSVAALGTLAHVTLGRPTIRARVAGAVLVAGVAVICFTTVGRLWLIPGLLLIVAATAILAGAVPGLGDTVLGRFRR